MESLAQALGRIKFLFQFDIQMLMHNLLKIKIIQNAKEKLNFSSPYCDSEAQTPHI